MKYFAKKRKQDMDSYIKEAQNYSAWFGDAVGGVREIRSFGKYDNKWREFREKKSSVIEKEKKMTMLGAWNSVADSTIIQFMMALLYIIGANYVISGSLSVGNIFAFINYSVFVTGPISTVLNIGYYMSGIIPSTKRFYEFITYEEENDAEYVDEDVSILPNERIVFEDVSFSYDDTAKVLDHVNLTIISGSKTVIMGDNGSGKRTILDLISRFYEPTEGRILLGGKDIRGFALENYRNYISVVSQNIYLFDDKIRKNIALYQEVSDAEIKEACAQSGLMEFVDEVTLDYCVGNNGMMLSGGQKQKIALARALIHDTPIIIFDEATSNADSDSIKQINGLLHTLLKEKTVLIVSHQTEILQDADFVYTLVDGKIDKMH
jgi:ABC-type multidrug transport system fused ATPase/permease subunit